MFLLQVKKPPEWWLRWRLAKIVCVAFIPCPGGQNSNGVFACETPSVCFEGLNVLNADYFMPRHQSKPLCGFFEGDTELLKANYCSLFWRPMRCTPRSYGVGAPGWA
jgi:hypothetical protein